MVQAGRIIPSPQLFKDAGEILPLGQLYQSSFDAINNGMDVTNTEQDDTVATISRDGTTKTTEKKLKKTGVRVDFSLDDVLRFSTLSRSEAARGLQVSDSTLKRICRRHGILRWPPRNINKDEAFPIALPNVGAIVHVDSLEEPSWRELDAAIDGGHDLWEDDSLPSISNLENKVRASTFKHIGGQHGITPWPNRQVVHSFIFDKSICFVSSNCNGEGAMTCPDSLDQPSMDALIAERNDLEVTCPTEGTIKMQKREQGKTGVRIEISLDDILLYSDKKLKDAAMDLKVSGSTLKRICRGYGIHRWPPHNISEPSHIKNEGQTVQLNSDLPLNQASVSVAHIKPESQEANKVLVKAKYGDLMLKFGLSLSAGFRELEHEVAKRLNLDVGTYYVKYQDEDDDLILLACDDDLRACVHSSISLGNTSTLVLLELKHPF
ncbi:protein NLP1-like isoform X2 [Rhododendron vialii]|uniref:protein NLP1-like isoform X2 n=1 Tax=Rhododendron vialii TaxID=182163 RepID=UPI00265FAA52|nr:protein NLP1-like isoform X2 [Rhododendron vialii]